METTQQNPRIILFYGPPGSGKGTQISLLADKTGIDILDAGHTFREFVKHNPENPIAKRMKHRMDQGKPIYTEDYFYILQQKIHNQIKAGKSIIFDKPGGSLLEEAEWFNNLVEIAKVETVLFNIPITLQESLRRIANRWFVQDEQRSWASKEEALKQANGDESKIFQREDDNLTDIITQRYNRLYAANCQQILTIFEKNPYAKVVSIPDHLSIQETHQFILKNL